MEMFAGYWVGMAACAIPELSVNVNRIRQDIAVKFSSAMALFCCVP